MGQGLPLFALGNAEPFVQAVNVPQGKQTLPTRKAKAREEKNQNSKSKSADLTQLGTETGTPEAPPSALT